MSGGAGCSVFCLVVIWLIEVMGERCLCSDRKGLGELTYGSGALWWGGLFQLTLG